MKPQTTTNPTMLSQRKWRFGTLLVALTSLAVLLSSCSGYFAPGGLFYTG